MGKFEKLSIEELKGFEDEVNKVIKEVELSEKKQKELEDENLSLKERLIQYQKFEQNNLFLLEENNRLKEQIKTKSDHEMSEKDLAEIMISAKKVSNLMIQEAKEDVEKVNNEKQKLLKSITQEGTELKHKLFNIKEQMGSEIDKWISSIERLTSNGGHSD